MTSTDFLADLIEHPDAEARVSALDEISRAVPRVPRALIAAALDGDIPAALEAVDIAFPGHQVILGKGRLSPAEPLFSAAIWQPEDDPGDEDAPPLGSAETDAGLAQALILALHEALTLTDPSASGEAETVNAPAPPATAGDPGFRRYERKHNIAAGVALSALRCALPDRDDAVDIVQAVAVLTCEVMMGAMAPENAEACIAEFERNVRGLITDRMKADVAGHA